MKGKADVKRGENVEVSALWRTNLSVGTAISRKTRQEKASALLVFLKRFTEIRCEEGLFFSRLSIETKEDDGESEQSTIFAYGERCPNYTYQHTGVNRMANVLIRSGADNLMSLLDGDCRAPIFAQVPARPDGEQNAGESYCAAQPRDPESIG
jgi:hypothetical protein